MKRVIFFFYLVAVILTAKAQEYVITDYGVGADSTKLNTSSIQQVIDKASLNGGGTIVIPKGVFLTGALFFKPHTKLRLAEGGVLKGSDNIAHYPLIPSRMEGKSIYYYAALINAYRVDSFSVTGPGVINGNGAKYWNYFWAYRDSMKLLKKSATNLEVHRPRLLFIWGCNHVDISNTTLCNSGFWTTHLYQCNDVKIENCRILSPFKPVKAPSTDGVDIDVCKDVTIRGCYISVNDDAVCVKGGKGPYARQLPENGPVENILVENCTFGESHGVLTLGSESLIARNITLRNCKVESKTPLLRIKMRPDTYQTFENVTLENITGSCGTVIEMRPWKQFFNMEGYKGKPYGIVRNITISNVKVNCLEFGEIAGNPLDQVSNFVLKNLDITTPAPELKTKYKGVILKNVKVNNQSYIKK